MDEKAANIGDKDLLFLPGKPAGDVENDASGDLESLKQKIRDLAVQRPIYSPESVRASHSLKYDWTGWLSGGAPFPSVTSNVLHSVAPLWCGDGLHMESFCAKDDQLQILFNVEPGVSPVRFTSRAKGRLQHALRQAGERVRFSRKVSFRCLGDNVRSVVEAYLGKQVRKEGFVDPRFARRMLEFSHVSDDVDLAEPAASVSGRYWYNLHVVLVVAGRRRIAAFDVLGRIRDGILLIGDEQGYRIKAFSVMPDHVHIAVGGRIEESPEDIALVFLNRLSFLLGWNRIWKDEYYVGTFSEYAVDVIRGRRR